MVLNRGPRDTFVSQAHFDITSVPFPSPTPRALFPKTNHRPATSPGKQQIRRRLLPPHHLAGTPPAAESGQPILLAALPGPPRHAQASPKNPPVSSWSVLMAKKKKADRNRGKNPAGMEAEAEGSAGRAPHSHGHGAPFDVRRGQENGAHPGGARPGQEAIPPHGTAQKIIEILRRAAAFMGRIGSAGDDTSDASSSSAGDDTSGASSIPGNGGVEAVVGERSRDQVSIKHFSL